MSQLNVGCWRKRDAMFRDHSFLEKFSEPPLEDIATLHYFLMFIKTTLLDISVEQTNIVFKLFMSPSMEAMQK